MDILIVEDNAANRRLLVDVLQAAHIQCVAAENAEEGIELAKLHLPKVILMDVNLPGMDGVTATSHLRTLTELDDTRIIGMSAHALRIELDKLDSSQFDHFFIKPFSYKKLLEYLVPIIRLWDR